MEKFATSVRIYDEDYEELKKIKDKTKVPVVSLIHIAIPMLKKKYRIKEVVEKNESVR